MSSANEERKELEFLLLYSSDSIVELFEYIVAIAFSLEPASNC